MDVPVKLGNSMLNSGRIIRLCQSHPIYTGLCSIQMQFAADRKQLVTSCPAAFVPEKCAKFRDAH